jgi:tryptophanyl-tRNA synthetase
MKKNNVIDPFGESVIKDYNKLFNELGLKPIDEKLLKRIKNPSRYLRRGIDFAHIDFDKFLDAVERKEKVAILTGIKPTNEFHLGSKMVAEKIIYFQKEFGAKVFYCIADLEALVDNGVPLEESFKIAIDNVADLLALGLDPKNAYIYRQSQEKRVMNLAYLFSRKITTNHMKNLYGERSLGLYFAAFTQAGDILLPQLKDFDGPKLVLVPVSVDQTPHIFLSRDIAKKFRDQFGFLPPAALFHKFIRSLDGSTKMSKRNPMGMITLNDSPELIRKKILKALTGGQKTIEEQRKYGGDPEKSVVFELLNYHFIEDDKEIRKIYEDYKSGRMLDGEMKELAIDVVTKFIQEHQKKKSKMIGLAKKILEENSF